MYSKCKIIAHLYAAFIPNNILNNMGFLDGSDGTESAFYAGDLGTIPGSGKSLGLGNGSPLQYSFLGNSMDREA